jgi:hypothetical protein
MFVTKPNPERYPRIKVCRRHTTKNGAKVKRPKNASLRFARLDVETLLHIYHQNTGGATSLHTLSKSYLTSRQTPWTCILPLFMKEIFLPTTVEVMWTRSVTKSKMLAKDLVPMKSELAVSAVYVYYSHMILLHTRRFFLLFYFVSSPPYILLCLLHRWEPVVVVVVDN